MKTKGDTVDAMAVIMGFEFDFTDAREVHCSDEVFKKIGECVGRVHAPEMMALVISGEETATMEPSYPSGIAPSKKDKPVWNESVIGI